MSNKDTQDIDSYEEFDEGEKTNHNNKNDVLAIQNIMQTENGRDWIWGHLISCCVFESTFNSDPIQSSYNAGLRDAGLRLEREVKEAAPTEYLKMIKESIDG